MHPNEAFLTTKDPIQLVKTLTEIARESRKLGESHINALREQIIRLGIVIDPE